MKLDMTKLPVDAAVVAFFIAVIGVTFAGAFAVTDNGGTSVVVSGSPTPRETGSPGPSPSPGGPVAVVMRDNSFTPNEITVPAGSTVTFDLTNDGGNTHNMHITGEGGEYNEDFCTGSVDSCSNPPRVRGSAKATLTWQAPASSGEVHFRCDFHPDVMTGTITVE